MSWPLSTHSHRLAIGAVSPLLVPGSADVEITLTRANASFWANVRSDGADLRAYDASGMNALEHKLVSWNYAAKSAQITVRGVPLPEAGALALAWLVFGAPTATSTATAFATVSPVAGIVQSDDAPPWPFAELIPLTSSRTSRAGRPEVALSAGVGVLDVWLDVGRGYLGRRAYPYQGRLDGEEVSSASITTSTVSPGTGLITASSASLALDSLDNGPVIRVRLNTSGALAGERYTVLPRITTTGGQVFVPAFRVVCS